ncbi:MAG: hypothetical protein JWQ72_2620 [Polaromonas sp.]|nr:hypothetical protein [Polaromonas sp.]
MNPSSPDRGVPLGTASPEQPGTLPGEPGRITRLEAAAPDQPPAEGDRSREQGGLSSLTGAPEGASGQTKAPGNEEPEPVMEEDLPSDGHDEVGEAMIRNLPQRPELSDPPPEPAERR